METKRPHFQRKRLIAHLSFGNFFLFRNDLTIFQVTAKDFQKREAGAQVINHPELKMMIPFDEIVYHVKSEEVAVISLLLQKYNDD